MMPLSRSPSAPGRQAPLSVHACRWMAGASRRGLVLALLVALLTGACSNRALYEIIQQNRLQACEELPIPQQAQCKAQYEKEYEDYRREREQL